jgi:hypothetical protein
MSGRALEGGRNMLSAESCMSSTRMNGTIEGSPNPGGISVVDARSSSGVLPVVMLASPFLVRRSRGLRRRCKPPEREPAELAPDGEARGLARSWEQVGSARRKAMLKGS